ncbi:LysR family transcriptional regulator [Trinickia soli]|uniref:LysR family transcriptional regulator n=1 Tax=Trinickia soli TaxID=380675 RepID=A0A2N7WCF9_9BURK|nr:LysR family transcriptional regulator [Trinickia soli]KAA0088606.1 LysR family transcriptional regulator [Paraburkholderia sp. T12-10]PMS27099.1 LysR family transcriptional regulator [Trinickia soli]
MIRLDDVQIFVHTVDYGSFSEAARQLNIAPAHASASVQRLERALDTRLFTRSTRSMQLSEAGERYLPHARIMIGALVQGEQALASGRGALSGPLRLSAPSDFGRNLLLPWLDEFQRRHPGLSLHLKMSDRAADLIRQPLDAVVRYGALPDSSLLAMKLVDNNRRALCAAPSYVQRHGAPAKVEDLRRHNCLRYVWSEQIHERWRFTPPGGERIVAVTGNRISDDADVVRRWAIAGEGIVYKSRLDLIDDLKAGRLVELFPPEHCEPSPLHLICAHRSQLTPAIIELHAFLSERCSALLASHPAGSSRPVQ